MNLRLFSLSTLFFALIFSASGQVNIGIKLSPGLTPVRATVLSDTMSLREEAKPLRFLAGIVVDYEFRDNYEFRTGVNFLSKKFQYDVTGDTQGVRYNDAIIGQYIQLPATLKLNTNEVTIDTKIYFQLGVSLDIRVHDNLDELANTLTTKTNFIDTSMNLGAGLERKMGTETRVFAGLAYQRAFLNLARETIRMDKKFSFQSSFIGLEAGVIF